MIMKTIMTPKMTTKITKPMLAKLTKMADQGLGTTFNHRHPNTVERRLIDEGYVALLYPNWTDRNDLPVIGAEITDAGWAAIGLHLVPCDGEAHQNPHIDNCSCCAPRWGQVAIPIAYASVRAWREAADAEREAL